MPEYPLTSNAASSIAEMATDADATGRMVLVTRPGRNAGDMIGAGSAASGGWTEVERGTRDV
ncbi:MAG: hypothetical protein C5S41_13410 [Candidatus Methanomarinus sp.]|nr:MAG: hypothetical protein C5S41_13410 [ANME-2 cluster archaeon]